MTEGEIDFDLLLEKTLESRITASVCPDCGWIIDHPTIRWCANCGGGVDKKRNNWKGIIGSDAQIPSRNRLGLDRREI